MQKVPSTEIKTKKVPIIGGVNEATKKQIEDTVDQRIQSTLQVLDNVLQNITVGLESLEKRVAVVEEVKQIFPSKIEVIVKKEG